MAQGWDDLPETDFRADPEARAPGYDRCVARSKAYVKATQARRSGAGGRAASLARRSQTDPDARLRRFDQDREAS